MRTHIGVEIAAPPRVVFDLVRDVARWPELLPHYRNVTVHARDQGHVLATMAAFRPLGQHGRRGVPVSWRAEQWADDSDPADLRLNFVHRAGPTRGMRVTWRIRPSASGSDVSIEHDFKRRLPFLGEELFPRLVDGLFVRPIAGRTLATFKALAEARSA